MPYITAIQTDAAGHALLAAFSRRKAFSLAKVKAWAGNWRPMHPYTGRIGLFRYSDGHGDL